MKVLSKSHAVLNTFAMLRNLTVPIALFFAPAAFALDPATLYQQASPAVAVINSPSIGEGSGFITDARGLILTNQHVVGKNSQVTVKLADGSVYRGVVVSRNPQFDVALIQIRPQRRLSSLKLRLIPPQIGQRVYAIGNPRGLNRSLSDGLVSRIDASGRIQFTATASFGSSGGPLLDGDGRVVGIIQGGIPGTDLNFALPIAVVNNLSKPQGAAAQQLQQIRNYLLASSLQLRQGNYRKMLAILNEAIRRYPNNASLYSQRGAAKSFLRDTQGAINDLDRSIQLKPTSQAHLNRARLYAAGNQPARSLSAFTEAIALNQGWGESNLGEAFYYRGRVQVQLKQQKAAIADFKQAASYFSRMNNARWYQAALDQMTLLMAQ